MMKRICYYHILATALLTLAACSPDTEQVFEASPAVRQQQAAAECQQLLEAAPQGWAVDFYPSSLEYGGIAYTALFADGQVTLACEQAVDNSGVDRRYAAGETVTSTYRLINGQGVELSFDTYNALIHYWSQPSGTDFDGYASDYEFTVVSATADSILLRGVRHGNLLRMYRLQEDAADYLAKVMDMRQVLSPDTRKRAVVDGETLPITALENHLDYTVDGVMRTVPYVYTASGLRFYQPVELGGARVMEMIYDHDSGSLQSADGRMAWPAPTAVERFCGASTQWHFIFGKTDASYQMCDTLRTLVKESASQLSRLRYETLKDVYIGKNKLDRSVDAQRIVMGWTSAYASWAYEVCHGIEMNVVGNGTSVAIQATERGNLFYNYTLFQPTLDFIVAGSPYVLTFDDDNHPTTVTLTSEQHPDWWFSLKQ